MNIKRLKTILTIAVVFAVLAGLGSLSGCASSNSGLSKVDKEALVFKLADTTFLAELSPENQKIFHDNWELGSELAAYDAFSWIASDSLLKYLDSLEKNNIQGWIVTGLGEAHTTVHFGMQNQKQEFLRVFSVDFFAGKVTVNKEKKSFPKGSRESVLFENLTTSKHRMKPIADSLVLVYNTYVLEREDKNEVYLIPGSRKDHLVFGAAYKAAFQKGKENQQSKNELKKADGKLEAMHLAPVEIEYSADAEYIFRGSHLVAIPNEVDFAQLFIYKDRAPIQFIGTKEFLFMCKWDEKARAFVMDVQHKDKKDQDRVNRFLGRK